MNYFLVSWILVKWQTDGLTESDAYEPTVHKHRYAPKCNENLSPKHMRASTLIHVSSQNFSKKGWKSNWCPCILHVVENQDIMIISIHYPFLDLIRQDSRVIVGQSWLSANLGFGSVRVCLLSVLTGIELCNYEGSHKYLALSGCIQHYHSKTGPFLWPTLLTESLFISNL